MALKQAELPELTRKQENAVDELERRIDSYLNTHANRNMTKCAVEIESKTIARTLDDYEVAELKSRYGKAGWNLAYRHSESPWVHHIELTTFPT